MGNSAQKTLDEELKEECILLQDFQGLVSQAMVIRDVTIFALQVRNKLKYVTWDKEFYQLSCCCVTMHRDASCEHCQLGGSGLNPRDV